MCANARELWRRGIGDCLGDGGRGTIWCCRGFPLLLSAASVSHCSLCLEDARERRQARSNIRPKSSGVASGGCGASRRPSESVPARCKRRSPFTSSLQLAATCDLYRHLSPALPSVRRRAPVQPARSKPGQVQMRSRLLAAAAFEVELIDHLWRCSEIFGSAQTGGKGCTRSARAHAGRASASNATSVCVRAHEFASRANCCSGGAGSGMGQTRALRRKRSHR